MGHFCLDLLSIVLKYITNSHCLNHALLTVPPLLRRRCSQLQIMKQYKLMLIWVRDLGEGGHLQGCFSDGCGGNYLGFSWWCYFNMLLVKCLVPSLSLFKLWCTFPPCLPHPWYWALFCHGDASRITSIKFNFLSQTTYLRYANFDFKKSFG